MVAAGLSNTEIASHLFISPKTVNSHLVRIYAKLGVNMRAAAMRLALKQSLTWHRRWLT
jgi:DNA-binding NarL/FixJ family response regulator